jgi:hypothetical protein
MSVWGSTAIMPMRNMGTKAAEIKPALRVRPRLYARTTERQQSKMADASPALDPVLNVPIKQTASQSNGYPDRRPLRTRKTRIDASTPSSMVSISFRVWNSQMCTAAGFTGKCQFAKTWLVVAARTQTA